MELNKVRGRVLSMAALLPLAGAVLAAPVFTVAASAAAAQDGTLVLSNTGPVPLQTGLVLNETATLSGADNPGGDISFDVTGPGSYNFSGTVPVDNGNAAYLLSTTGQPVTAAGTYTWSATYEAPDGTDVLANPDTAEVDKAATTLTTTVSPATARAGSVSVTETAVLNGAVLPSGSITFTLQGPGVSFQPPAQQVTSGQTSYSITQTFKLSAGTYTWTAAYSGDDNNAAASGPDQRIIVTAAPAPPQKKSPPHAASEQQGSLVSNSKSFTRTASGTPKGGVATGGGKASSGSGWMLLGMILAGVGALVLAGGGGAFVLRRRSKLT